jgi:mannose-6-phosphate isomerase
VTDSVRGALRLQRRAIVRPWGTERLGRTPEGLIGELRLAAEDSTILDGPLAGGSIAEWVAESGVRVLGAAAAALDGGRFPFLVKILGTGEWMSVQVHPDDAAARRLAPDSDWRGKHEFWLILDADVGARLRIGVRSAVCRADLAAAAGSVAIAEMLAMRAPHIDELHEVPPGTLHAIGPGLLIWEAQTRSDLTWRLWDFGRDRSLQVPEALAVATLGPAPDPRLLADGVATGGPFSIERLAFRDAQRWTAPASSCAVLTSLGRQASEHNAWLVPAGESAILPPGDWVTLTVA